MGDTIESGWARLVTMGGGKQVGFQWLPEVGDEVMVAFWNGDINYPYVLGGVYSEKNKPPEGTNQQKDGKVVERVIRTRSGHKLRFLDAEHASKAQIELMFHDETGFIRISDNGGKTKIEITTTKGEIIVNSKEGTTVNADGAVTVNSKDKVDIKATKAITVKSSSDAVTVQGSKDLTLKGMNVTVQASASMTVKASSSLTVQSSGVLTLKGSLVKIN